MLGTAQLTTTATPRVYEFTPAMGNHGLSTGVAASGNGSTLSESISNPLAAALRMSLTLARSIHSGGLPLFDTALREELENLMRDPKLIADLILAGRHAPPSHYIDGVLGTDRVLSGEQEEIAQFASFALMELGQLPIRNALRVEQNLTMVGTLSEIQARPGKPNLHRRAQIDAAITSLGIEINEIVRIDPKVVPHVIKYLAAPGRTAEVAGLALRESPDSRVGTAILEILRSTDSNVNRAGALEASVGRNHPEIESELLRFAGTTGAARNHERLIAFRALASLESDDALRSVAHLMVSSLGDYHVQIALAKELRACTVKNESLRDLLTRMYRTRGWMGVLPMASHLTNGDGYRSYLINVRKCLSSDTFRHIRSACALALCGTEHHDEVVRYLKSLVCGGSIRTLGFRVAIRDELQKNGWLMPK